MGSWNKAAQMGKRSVDIVHQAPSKSQLKTIIEDIKLFSKQPIGYQIRRSFDISERLIRFDLDFAEVEFARGQYEFCINGLKNLL